MPLILVGIPVSSASPKDQAAASRARPRSAPLLFSRAQRGRRVRGRSPAGPGPRPARVHPLHPPGATPRRERRHQKLISFIWSPGNPLPAGTGGSENYTVGQVRELQRRGKPAQVVTVGLGTDDGRDGFAGIPFLSLPTLAEVGD